MENKKILYGIVEFQGCGVMLTIIKPLFDLSSILNEKEGIGVILKAGFSYNVNPSLIVFIAYISYIVGFGYYFFFRNKKSS